MDQAVFDDAGKAMWFASFFLNCVICGSFEYTLERMSDYPNIEPYICKSCMKTRNRLKMFDLFTKISEKPKKHFPGIMYELFAKTFSSKEESKEEQLLKILSNRRFCRVVPGREIPLVGPYGQAVLQFL